MVLLQINVLQARVDEQAERLGINLPYQTPYAKLTNHELKTAVQDIAGKLQVFASRADEFPYLKVQEIVDADREWALSRAKNEQEKEQILQKYLNVYTTGFGWMLERKITSNNSSRRLSVFVMKCFGGLIFARRRIA